MPGHARETTSCKRGASAGRFYGISNAGTALSSIGPEMVRRSCQSPAMKRSTPESRYLPLVSGVMVGATEVPWPIAGIHGLTASTSPSRATPSLAPVMVSSMSLVPCSGGCGEVRTAISSCPDWLVTVMSGGATKPVVSVGPLDEHAATVIASPMAEKSWIFMVRLPVESQASRGSRPYPCCLAGRVSARLRRTEGSDGPRTQTESVDRGGGVHGSMNASSGATDNAGGPSTPVGDAGFTTRDSGITAGSTAASIASRPSPQGTPSSAGARERPSWRRAGLQTGHDAWLPPLTQVHT